MRLVFEWDEGKNWQNLLKHDITFEEATVIWSDPCAIEFFDEDHSVLEERWIRIGLNPLKGILIVVFCERDEAKIRLISARRATPRERDYYER